MTRTWASQDNFFFLMTPFGIADNLCLSNGALVPLFKALWVKIATKSLILRRLFSAILKHCLEKEEF